MAENSTRDVIYVMDRVMKAKALSRKWHPNIKKWRRLYNQERSTRDYSYIDPSYTNAVDVAVGILGANKLDITAHGFVSDPSEEAATTRVEKFLLGIFNIAGDRSGVDLEYENLMQLVRDGVTVTYAVWDKRMARSHAQKVDVPDIDQGSRKADAIVESPFYFEVVDPLEVHMLPGAKNGRWSTVARIIRASYYEIEQKYGVVPRRARGMTDKEKKMATGEFVDFWEIFERPEKGSVKEKLKDFTDSLGLTNADPLTEVPYETVVRNAVVFDFELVRPLREMDGYNNLPYEIGFYKPIERSRPEYWSSGIIAPMESSVTALVRAINRRDRQITVFSELPMLARSGVVGQEIAVDPGMGNVVQLGPQDDFGFARWPGNPPDVEEHIGFMSRRLQQSSFNDALFLGNFGAGSGYALAQISDTNRIRLLQPKRHLEKFYENIANKVLDMCDEFAPETFIRVYGRRKGQFFAEQMVGHEGKEYIVEAFIDPEFPSERQRNHAMATQVAGILSQRTIMERYLGINNPDDERERRIYEEIMNSPEAKQYSIRKALRTWAETGDADAMKIMEMMDAGMIQQGSQPPREGGIENTPGMLSASGQQIRQEGGDLPAAGPQLQ